MNNIKMNSNNGDFDLDQRDGLSAKELLERGEGLTYEYV